MANNTKLPAFLEQLEVVEKMSDYNKKLFAESPLKDEEVEINVDAFSQPVSLMPKFLREAYEQNNMSAVKATEEQTRRDIEPILENIKIHGEDAWVKVKDISSGVEYFISYSDNAVIWAYPSEVITNDEIKIIRIMMGSYSNTTRQANASTVSFTMDVKTGIELVLSCICAMVLYRIVLSGLRWAVSSIAMWLAQAAARLGYNQFRFVITETALKLIAGAFTAVLMIGVSLLIDWIISLLTKDYYISLRIYNYDDKNVWLSKEHYFDNATIAGDKDSYKDFDLPKKERAIPPGFIPPATSDDIIVYYAEINLKNDSTFLEGLAVALSMAIDNGNSGITFAVDCPYITKSKLKITNVIENDLKQYYKQDNWVEGNHAVINVNGLPVSIYLHDIENAENGLYIADVFIGKES